MSPSLKKYYDLETIKDIAKAEGISTSAMNNRLRKERVSLGLPKRVKLHDTNPNILTFAHDKDLVLALVNDGLSPYSIAKKWDISSNTVNTYLKYWGVELKPKEELGITLSEFYSGWELMDEEVIIRVRNKPMFKVTRI